jgi:hypothetical protein
MTKDIHAVTSALRGSEVTEFLHTHIPTTARTLFVGNVGFGPDSVFFCKQLAGFQNVDFRYFVEIRPNVPQEVIDLAKAREADLRALVGDRLQIEPISICAADGAPIGGRSACLQVGKWLASASYSDVVIDATGMSRGTLFPVARQVCEGGKGRFRVHMLVASSNLPGKRSIESISCERPDWIHGFQGSVELDSSADALRLWVVQLQQGAEAALGRLFTSLVTPSEVCPIVPFPSRWDPRTGDRLLFELRKQWIDTWGETPLSLIYADDEDPTDVYRSIVALHRGRQESLQGAAVESITILSPLGPRLPSVGMFLAALEYDLPVYYLETVGYKVNGPVELSARECPERMWCFRFPQ